MIKSKININHKMKKHSKISILFYLVIILMPMFFLTGCDIQIFESKDAQYTIKEISKESLEDGTYYIKNGTKFCAVYLPEGTVAGNIQKVSPDRLFWMWKDQGKIPTYYKGELIAYASSKYEDEPINIERYQDAGYSIGVHGAKYNEQGYIEFNLKQNCIKGSQAYKQLSQAKSEEFRIVEINGEAVTADMLNNGGIFSCFERDKEYTISLYEGTYYNTITMKADTWLIQSYEVYTLQNRKDSKNGYISLELPEDMKSGYYYIPKAGIFRYLDKKKNDIEKTNDINMNEPYYQTETEQIKAFSQQFSLIFDKKAADTKVVVNYVKGMDLNETEIKGLITAPDNTVYECTLEDENKIVCNIKEAVAGTWTLNIVPSTLAISDIAVESNNPGEERKEEVYEFNVEKDIEEAVFVVEYDGIGTVSALLIKEKEETVPFEKTDRQTNKLVCRVPYLNQGHYSVKVYHNTDTSIHNVTYMADNENYQKDVIVVTE